MCRLFGICKLFKPTRTSFQLNSVNSVNSNPGINWIKTVAWRQWCGQISNTEKKTFLAWRQTDWKKSIDCVFDWISFLQRCFLYSDFFSSEPMSRAFAELKCFYSILWLAFKNLRLFNQYTLKLNLKPWSSIIKTFLSLFVYCFVIKLSWEH